MTNDDIVVPCAEKIAYDTKKQATAASTVADWQHGAKVKPYKCQYCQLWHLATNYDTL